MGPEPPGRLTVTEGTVVLGSTGAEGAGGASVASGNAVPAARGQLLGLACQRWSLRPTPPQQGASSSFSGLLRGITLLAGLSKCFLRNC